MIEYIDRYEIRGEIGRGAMGVVYKAFDPELSREVAIKVISENWKDNREALLRFKNEIQATGRLDHENIAMVFDAGEEDGQPYLVMQYLEGVTLYDLVREVDRFPLERVLNIATQIAKGLAHAHEAGIIHRDVKPANMMVLDGDRVKIVDFGIARLVSSTLTRGSMSPGSPGYMSPEQIRGMPLDVRSDIFSFGVVLYEMLSGRHPFTAGTQVAVWHRICNEHPEPLELLEPAIQDPLQRIVSTCLAKDREDRYDDLHGVIQELTHIRNHVEGSSESISGIDAGWPLIPGYRLLRQVRQDHVGTVYQARGTSRQEVVSLRIFRKALTATASFEPCIRERVRGLRALQSPHVTRVHTVQRSDTRLFIVQEHVEGRTLRSLLDEAGALAWPRVLDYVKPLVKALGDAADHDIVHGDVCPANVWLTQEGTIKLSGFDPALPCIDGIGYTMPRKEHTALAYLAPERFEATTPVDHRSDLYAVGMICYEMLSGSLPYDPSSEPLHWVQHVREGKTAPLDERAPEVPSGLARVVMRALERDPDRRYQHASEMLVALEAVEAEEKPTIHRVRPNPVRASQQAQEVVVSGANFRSGAQVWVHDHHAERREAVVHVRSLRSDEIVFPHVFASDEARWSIEVVNPDGASSGEFALAEKKVRGRRLMFVGAILTIVGLLFYFFLVFPQGSERPQAGTLSVTTRPAGANVFLDDGTLVGQTPLQEYSFEGDTLALRLRKDAFEPLDTVVQRQGGDALVLNVALNPLVEFESPPDSTTLPTPEPVLPGTLVLNAVPAGSVFLSVDDRSVEVGQTAVPAGAHTVRCSHPDYGEVQTQVHVGAGQADTLTCYFERTVVVGTETEQGRGNAPWARVLIDDEPLQPGETPRTFSLPPGTYTIDAHRVGYDILTPPQTLVIEPSFTEEPYRITFKIKE